MNQQEEQKQLQIQIFVQYAMWFLSVFYVIANSVYNKMINKKNQHEFEQIIKQIQQMSDIQKIQLKKELQISVNQQIPGDNQTQLQILGERFRKSLGIKQELDVIIEQ